jgi:hypothetical protein
MQWSLEWKDGVCTECVNILALPDNSGYVRSDLKTNGVLVQLLPGVDHEGNWAPKRFVTVLCVDPDMLDDLKAEALRILRDTPHTAQRG